MADHSTPLFGVRTTLVLAAVLIVSFGTSYVTSVEPFPAVIFPAGASTVITRDGEVGYPATLLIAYDASGEPVELDAAAFLDPMPNHYLNGLAGNSFGQRVDPEITISVKRLDLNLSVPRHVPSAAEREEVRRWLGDRLEELGWSRARFVVREVWVTADAETGEELRRVVGDEITIDL